MKYLILFLSFAASAQTCNQAVITQGTGTINVALAGCGVTPTPTPTPTPVLPPVVTPVVTPVVNTDNIPNPSKYAFINGPFHAGQNGAGPEVNAYEMPASRCNSDPPIARSWQHNIDLQNYKSKNAFDFFVMNAGEALSYKFTVGMADASGGFIYNDAANAVVRPTFMSITTSPCDFDRAKIGLPHTCHVTGLNGNSINWANITGVLPISYCRLVKGQTYYINLRFQDARPGMPSVDSCITGNCGGIIQLL